MNDVCGMEMELVRAGVAGGKNDIDMEVNDVEIMVGDNDNDDDDC